MSVQGFQFEPTYPPGREPPIRDEIEGEEVINSPEFVRVGNTEWCECGNCTSLPTQDECECCLELDVLNQKFDDSGVDCITEHPKFGLVCLDTDVLSTALVAIHTSRSNPVPDPITNRTWRIASYRQFTWWTHGTLGKKRRRVIPSCVVTAIRRAFPEENGVYVGFKQAEIDLD